MPISFTPEAVTAARDALAAALEAADPISLAGTSARKLAINLARQLNQLSAAERAQLQALDGVAGFAGASLTTCEHAVVLLWNNTQVRDTAAAQADDRQIPIALLTEAADSRALLLKVLDYHLGDDAAVVAELADIRKGSGHLDLASDLQRLAKLARSQAAELAGDRYLPADAAAQADALATRILGDYVTNDEDERLRALDEQRRILAVLDAAYAEVSAAARFALRGTGIAETFQSLRVISRR